MAYLYVNNVWFLYTHKKVGQNRKTGWQSLCPNGKVSPHISFIKIIVYWIIDIVLGWNLRYKFWVMKSFITDSKLAKDWCMSKLKTNIQLNFSEIERRSKKKRKGGKEIYNVTYSSTQHSRYIPLSILNMVE